MHLCLLPPCSLQSRNKDIQGTNPPGKFRHPRVFPQPSKPQLLSLPHPALLLSEPWTIFRGQPNEMDLISCLRVNSFQRLHATEAGAQLKDNGDKALALPSQHGGQPRRSLVFRHNPCRKIDYPFGGRIHLLSCARSPLKAW